ncbi:MAG TPA: PhnD/SsuA/transferrin family substrate-binding protein [Dongiaceae bacterium]|jgi:ABC-type phosphate/phosphonate transport system substrate-binding protein
MNSASLPMYNPAEDPGASAALWRGIAHHLIRAGIPDVPERLLDRPPIPDHWLSGDLLFSQTCGYPLTHALKDRVQLLATPCYAAEGCEGSGYCSFVIVGAESSAATLADLRGKRLAFNTPDSQSGMNALRGLVAPIAERKKFFGDVIETGSHSASLAHVASGKADVAAIDCVSFALFSRHGRADIRRVRVLCRTASAPNLPFITARSTPPERVQRLRDGLRAAMADPALAGARQALLLSDIMLLPESAYQPLLDMERDAERLGYPRLS